MSYVIKAVLSSPQHLEYGQATIPFPIPTDQYDKTIEMLQATGMGFAVDRDCFVEEIESWYHVLGAITNTLVNIDQLDYLAKRLNGFRAEEVSQFEAMAHKLNVNNVQDLINLTFCCQQVTVITDFSNLEAAGRNHFMNLNRGSAMMKELENLDGTETARLLINAGEGAITPYGVVYDNGMELEQIYNGCQFPVYPYNSPSMVLEITQKLGLAEEKNLEYLYLPASKHQIERTLLRVGVTALCDAQIRLNFDVLPKNVADVLELDHLSGDDIPVLNRMCWAIEALNTEDMEKLAAVVLMADPCDAGEVCELAENLDQFDFVPGVQTPEEYGRYMIRESGRFEFDENLEDFYNYKQYGEQQFQQEGGQFNACGYVAYHGTMTLEELMMEDPAERYQREQEQQMGGQS